MDLHARTVHGQDQVSKKSCGQPGEWKARRATEERKIQMNELKKYDAINRKMYLAQMRQFALAYRAELAYPFGTKKHQKQTSETFLTLAKNCRQFARE